MNGVLFGHDVAVGEWVFANYKIMPIQFNMAVGILTPEGQLAGAALFSNFNGYDVSCGYYGKGTLSLGIIRTLARTVIYRFDPARVTFNTSMKNRTVIHWLPKIGCKVEGTLRCYYGRTDTKRHTAIRFVLFRDALERLAQHTALTEKVG